ncbi:hypothetical protein SAMN05421881_100534 [Nitrosomonas halophila]|uniref:Uncharacterized protein n=1 Tax=Nitrosomonas halophila TaxID=44576 RepID=A0A1H3DH54_9PROT|nr:hypothetical protein SAMN05421881_100534 [Nitrosomonas halophila]
MRTFKVFQSSPSRMAGRYLPIVALGKKAGVSILAQPNGRALRQYSYQR